jgi:hypothetical protein
MPNRPYTWLSASAVLVLVSACATTRSFQDMDADGNGRIDFEEASRNPDVADFFRSADDDRSGDLDAEEYASIQSAIERERHDIPRRSAGRGDVSVGR